jgi:TATA-box binding protein (TBP) (component of TFIID and TFIIIB)
MNNKYEENVNSINIYFDIGFKIDRAKLYQSMIENEEKYICKYNPESYCGINMTYKQNNELKRVKNELRDRQGSGQGICKCLNNCTCTNITFLIFHSGKVISTGYKNINDIEKIYGNFIKLFNNFRNLIEIN